MFKNLTIKRKLMAIMMLTSVIAVLCAGTTMIIFDVSKHRQQMVDELTMLAEVTGHNCRAPLAFDVPEDAKTVLSALAAKPSIVYACVCEAGGAIFATYGRDDGDEEVERRSPLEEGHRFGGGYLRVTHQIELGGEIVGTVYLQGDMRKIQEGLRYDAGILALAVIIALVVALLLSARLQVFISRPILALAGLADAVSRNHDYSVRGEKQQDDEVGLLVSAFNGMLTDIQQRDEALRQSEARYRGIVEDQTELICRNLPDCTLTFVNDAYCRYFCRSPEELVGNKFLPLIPPEDQPKIEAHFASLTHGAPVGTHEHRVIAPDGRIRWHQWTNRAIFDKDGRLTEFQGVGRDITERKKAEEALRESEMMNRSLLEGSPVCNKIIDLDSKLRYMSAAGVKHLKIPDIKPYYGQIYPPEFYPELMRTPLVKGLKLAMAGKISSVEAPVHDMEGNEVWYDTTFVPALDDDGRTKYVIGSSVNITERKRAEGEMRRLRLLLKNMIDSMPSSLVAVDAEGRVTHWNRRAEETTGVSLEEAEGQPLDKVFPAMEAQLAQVREALRQREAMTAQRIESFTDGERHFSDVMVYPLVTNGVDGAVIRVDDVTERVHLEEMMIQSEKMLSVGGLAAGMAHEINNPLAGIMQNVQVVLDRISTELPANVEAARDVGINLVALAAYMERRKIVDMLNSVRKSGKRAAKVVDNMLSFSRKSEAHFSSHDLGRLLDQTVELAGNDYDLKKKYDFKQIEIVREFDPELPEVSCEGPKIQQVILNLLKNGAQAMAEQENRASVPRFVLRTLRDGDMARIEVEDNGPGMTAEVRKRLFEPFFTTKKVGAGTGLGLSVSYFIVTENHRGTMTVESVPGQGTRFIIHLPMTRGS